MNPTQAAPKAPPKPELKKVHELAHFETDALHILVGNAVAARRALEQSPEMIRSKEAEQALTQYCNRVILRAKGDPAKHAISPDLEWIIEIPRQEIAAVVQQKVQQDATALQEQSEPSNVLEMTPAAP